MYKILRLTFIYLILPSLNQLLHHVQLPIVAGLVQRSVVGHTVYVLLVCVYVCIFLCLEKEGQGKSKLARKEAAVCVCAWTVLGWGGKGGRIIISSSICMRRRHIYAMSKRG